MSSTAKFNPDKLDFSACVPPCEPDLLHPSLVKSIQLAQRFAGFTFTITSAFRSKSWELSKGRSGASSHSKTPGLAVDISARDSHTRFKVVASLLSAGIGRIGIGKTFVHCDIDDSKAHPIIFHYYD